MELFLQFDKIAASLAAILALVIRIMVEKRISQKHPQVTPVKPVEPESSADADIVTAVVRRAVTC